MAEELRQYTADNLDFKVFLAPNTSDEDISTRCKNLLVANGVAEGRIQINYDIQQLEKGDLYASFDPPDLVIRLVYEKKASGIVKMKSLAMLRL